MSDIDRMRAALFLIGTTCACQRRCMMTDSLFESSEIRCFFDCGHVEYLTSDWHLAQDAMETHYEAAHKKQIDRMAGTLG